MTDLDRPTAVVARDTELTALRQHLLRVGEVGARVVVVAGPSGTGSSAVVRQVATEHRAAGGRCREARGVSWERDIALGVLSQLVGRALPEMTALAAATRLVDSLDNAPAEGPEPPVLLVVDDAAWSDLPSLQALMSAASHHREVPLLVLLAVSTSPATPHDAAVVLDAVEDRLVLSPLDTSGVQALAAARGVALHPSLADRLCRFTGGRPGPVLALLSELPAEFWQDLDPAFPAPAALASSVADRLRAVGDDARSLGEAVSILGRTPIALAASVADLADPLPALDELVAGGLVTTTTRLRASLLQPADPMVAAAVIASLGQVRLAELHRTAAGLVEDPVARLAHLVAASPLPDAGLADELDALATVRAQSGEWSAVSELLTSSSRLTSDATVREDRLSRAFDALVGAGDTLGAAAAVAEVESLRETPLRNAALAYLAIVRGRSVEAESRLGRAWDLVNVERDPDVAALICQRRVLHSLARCRGEELMHWADRGLALAPPGSPAAVEAAAIRGLGVAGTGYGADALADHVRLAEQVGHGAQAQRVAMGRGWLDVVVRRRRRGVARPAPRRPRRTSSAARRGSRCGRSAGWPAPGSSAGSGTRAVGRRPGRRWPTAPGSPGRAAAGVDGGPGARDARRPGRRRGGAAAQRGGPAGLRDHAGRRLLARARGRGPGRLRPRRAKPGAAHDAPGGRHGLRARVVAVGRRVRERAGHARAHDEADAFLGPHEQLAAERGHRSTRPAWATPAVGCTAPSATSTPRGPRSRRRSATSTGSRCATTAPASGLPSARPCAAPAGGARRTPCCSRRASSSRRSGGRSYVGRCDRELRAGHPRQHAERTAEAAHPAGDGRDRPRRAGHDEPRGGAELPCDQDRAVPPDPHLHEARRPVPRELAAQRGARDETDAS